MNSSFSSRTILSVLFPIPVAMAVACTGDRTVEVVNEGPVIVGVSPAPGTIDRPVGEKWTVLFIAHDAEEEGIEYVPLSSVTCGLGGQSSTPASPTGAANEYSCSFDLDDLSGDFILRLSALDANDAETNVEVKYTIKEPPNIAARLEIVDSNLGDCVVDESTVDLTVRVIDSDGPEGPEPQVGCELTDGKELLSQSAYPDSQGLARFSFSSLEDGTWTATCGQKASESSAWLEDVATVTETGLVFDSLSIPEVIIEEPTDGETYTVDQALYFRGFINLYSWLWSPDDLSLQLWSNYQGMIGEGSVGNNDKWSIFVPANTLNPNGPTILTIEVHIPACNDVFRYSDSVELDLVR